MAGRSTRFELLTPRGPGGVAVVAVRGADRHAEARRFLAPVPSGSSSTPTGFSMGGRPRLALLRIGSTTADEVLIVDRPEAEVLELHLHGSPAVVSALETAVGGFASVGEARGDSLLRGASSREQLHLALEQRGLDFARELAAILALEKPDREEPLRAALARSRVALALVAPRRLVLCGDQNAGKSTLMNRLLFRERVVTGDHPGLTRDPVREAMTLDGYPYDIVDTAGEGRVEDAVDRDALALARDARREGLRLLVVDGSRGPSPSDRQIRNEETLVVRSKVDLVQARWPDDFRADVELSCLARDSAAVVRLAVGSALRRSRGLPPAGAVGGFAALTPAEHDALVAAHQAAGS